MNQDDEDLAGIDLHAWRVPPPMPVDRSSLVGRALAPAAGPARRPRLRWLIAGIVLANAALATLIVILFARPAQTKTVVTLAPAGGSSIDAQVTELLQRLEQEQHELEGKVGEIRELRTHLLQLAKKAQDCEERERTVPKKGEPAPIVVAPELAGSPSSCDEVSCVLTNYESGCCNKYKKQPAVPPPPGPPESLDRAAISNGVASVKATIAACSGTEKGTVKVHVRVDPNGLVDSVEIAATPDAQRGACVKAAMYRAVFPKTKTGGSFSYPFVF